MAICSGSCTVVDVARPRGAALQRQYRRERRHPYITRLRLLRGRLSRERCLPVRRLGDRDTDGAGGTRVDIPSTFVQDVFIDARPYCRIH